MSHKIYRYESPYDGLGVYNCSMSLFVDYNSIINLRNRLEVAHNDWLHPSIREDLKLLDRNKFFRDIDAYRTGCDSIKALRQWFKTYNLAIQEAGFILVEYTVSTIMTTHSGKQCVFDIKDIISKKIVEKYIE